MSLKEFFSIKGRVSRKEYLLSYILYPILIFLITVSIWFLSVGVLQQFEKDVELLSILFLIITTLILYVLIFSVLIGGVKRLHDFCRSSWYVLLMFIPLGVAILIEPNFYIFIVVPNTLFASIVALTFIFSGLIFSIPSSCSIDGEDHKNSYKSKGKIDGKI
jgi:uncharacterized membrane protein YhaH (DUF805 family)